MTVHKITSESYGNLGRRGTRKNNEKTAIDGLIFCTPAFTNTLPDFLDESTWVDGIMAKTVFPLTGLNGYEVQSSEDMIFEAPSGDRTLLKRGKTRYKFNFNIPFNVHRTLMRYYNNADLRVFFVRDGKIDFYNDNGTAKGYSLSMLNIGRMDEVPEDGSSPAFTPVFLDLEDYRQHDVYGELVTPTWNVRDLEPIIDVKIAQEDSPKSTTSIAFKVYAEDGYGSDGLVNKVFIGGLLAADIDFFAADGTTPQAAWTLAESNGVYTITSTTPAELVAGKLTITPTSVTDGIIIEHADAAISIAVA